MLIETHNLILNIKQIIRKIEYLNIDDSKYHSLFFIIFETTIYMSIWLLKLSTMPKKKENCLVLTNGYLITMSQLNEEYL